MSLESIFDVCRNVDAKEVARALGLEFPRGSKRAVCPFCGHIPATISFTGNLFHCFCCGAAGDAVKLVEMHLGIKPFEAAKWVNREFNCGFTGGKATREEIQRAEQRALEKQKYEQMCAACKYLITWARGYLSTHAPSSEENLSDEYMELLSHNYMFDTLLEAVSKSSRDYKLDDVTIREIHALISIHTRLTGSDAYTEDL